LIAKIGSLNVVLLWCKQQSSHDIWQHRDAGTDIATSFLRENNETETMHCDAAQKDSVANLNTKIFTLQINVDFPSYLPQSGTLFNLCYKSGTA
jgi:hypothetical protein